MKLNKLNPRFVDYSASNKVADTAINTGRTAISSFDPTATANIQKSNLGASGLGGLLGNETNAFTSEYAKAVAANPTVTQLYNTANNLYNVPALATTATNLSNRVTNMTPNAYTAARGFDINATDINNGIAASSQYLTPQSNAATANYNTAAGLASNFVTAGQAQNAQNLLPIQAKQQLVIQQQAAQATGWNNAAQSEFDALVSKMQAGVTLSTTEMARANQLASLEEAYQQAIDTANIQNQYKILTPAQTLANTMTGATYRAK